MARGGTVFTRLDRRAGPSVSGAVTGRVVTVWQSVNMPADAERIHTAVRLPAALKARLDAEAHARDLSANWIITRAVEQYLDRLAPLPSDGADSPVWDLT